MGGALTADCGAPAGQELATRVGCQLAITPSFLIPFSHHTTHSSFGGGWPQKRSLAPLGNYKATESKACEGRVAAVPKAVTLQGQKVSKALRMYRDVPLERKGFEAERLTDTFAASLNVKGLNAFEHGRRHWQNHKLQNPRLPCAALTKTPLRLFLLSF